MLGDEFQKDPLEISIGHMMHVDCLSDEIRSSATFFRPCGFRRARREASLSVTIMEHVFRAHGDVSGGGCHDV
jgi:hypothetical protein